VRKTELGKSLRFGQFRDEKKKNDKKDKREEKNQKVLRRKDFFRKKDKNGTLKENAGVT